MPNLTYKLINPAEYWKEIIDLYSKALGGSITREQYIWKYEENPLGMMKIWSAWNNRNNKLVATLAAFKRQFIFNGKIIIAYHLADGMVDVRYRGQGVYRIILDEMIDSICREGAVFWMGYPNDQAAPVYRKYSNSRELYLSHTYVFINGVTNIASNFLKLKYPLTRMIECVGSPFVRSYNKFRNFHKGNDLSFESVESFNELPEQWSFEAAEEYRFFPYRDRQFLQWKAINVPSVIKKDIFPYWLIRGNERIGYCVLYRDSKRNILKLLDILCKDPELNLMSCFEWMRHYAISNNFDAIVTNVSSDLYQKVLSSLGFIKAKKVRARVSFFNKNVYRDIVFDSSFWFQLPIDRDNFSY